MKGSVSPLQGCPPIPLGPDATPEQIQGHRAYYNSMGFLSMGLMGGLQQSQPGNAQMQLGRNHATVGSIFAAGSLGAMAGMPLPITPILQLNEASEAGKLLQAIQELFRQAGGTSPR